LMLLDIRVSPAKFSLYKRPPPQGVAGEVDERGQLIGVPIKLVKTTIEVPECQSNAMEGTEAEAYIVNMSGEIRVIDVDLRKELERDGGRRSCITVTAVKDTVAEGYNSESSVHVLKGADGKFYVVHSYAGFGCGHDNKVVDVFDDFKLNKLSVAKEAACSSIQKIPNATGRACRAPKK